MKKIILADKIQIGHDINYERKSFVKKSNNTDNVDTSKVFNDKMCVIHLIDLEPVKARIQFLIQANEDSDIKTTGSKMAKHITKYITDQYSELWNMMKYGDLIEDISSSGYRSEGRYIVDRDLETKDLGILRNGLIIKDLYRDYDIYGSILPKMYTITKFPIGYFDNPIINTYLGSSMKSYWHCQLCPVIFNVKKLHLDTLTQDNIYHMNLKLDDLEDSFNSDADYLYVILKFRNNDYMIIKDYSNRYSRYCMKKELNMFIKMFKKNIFHERYDHMDNKNILHIAQIEKIDLHNIILL
jgi:hypothetical protein